MKDVLLEIGTEELPARFLTPALAALEAGAKERLAQAGLAFASLRTLGTPRRLALLVTGLADRAEDQIQEFLGPSLAQAKDAEGRWTAAAQGFARAQGVSPEDLETRSTERGPRLLHARRTPGRPAAEVLPTLLPELIRSIPFPKSMVWEETRVAFARPIRWIAALHGPRLVAFSLAGVKSGRKTRGLRFHARRPLEIPGADRYAAALRNHCVIADPEERRRLVVEQIRHAVKSVHGHVLLEKHGDLLEEVVNLVEHPVAVVGRFGERFLTLPPEVLTTSMKRHQKYFPVHADAEGRTLKPGFVGIRNGLSENQAAVREGYERVLAARLEDAAFFFAQDRRRRLEDRVADLGRVAFLSGTLLDKTDRVQALVRRLASRFGLSPEHLAAALRAGRLAKADLTTGMVGEFPELQGVMGRIYAGLDGESPEAARGVEEHHWPLTADGVLPSSEAAAVVAAADKLDTLAGNFLAGKAPTGSQDPYGLRRASVGLLRILESRGWSLSLSEAVAAALEAWPGESAGRLEAGRVLLDFLRQRWAALAELRGGRPDEIDAVSAVGWDDPVDAGRRLEAVRDIRRHPDFIPLVTAFRRAANLLKQAEKRGEAVPETYRDAPGSAEPERILARRVADIAARSDSHASHAARLAELVSLRGPVDDFFAAVVVMDPDPGARANRLALLAGIRRLFARVADFSRLQDTP